MMTDQAAQLRERMQKPEPVTDRNPAELIRPGRDPICRSIAVMSGKGGVGKSNVAILCAQSLARCKRNVLLLDADLGLANIHILLGLNPKHNLSHVMSGECNIEDILCRGPDGITVLPGASGIEALANADTIGIELFVRKLSEVEKKFDFLFVDVGAGIGQTAMRMGLASDMALLVLTPEPTSLADAYATAKVLFLRGMSKIEVMVNMATSDREGNEIFEKLRTLVKNFLGKDITLAGILPFDRDISRYVKAQKNILQGKPSSALAGRIVSYARRLSGMPPAGKNGFFGRLFNKSSKE